MNLPSPEVILWVQVVNDIVTSTVSIVLAIFLIPIAWRVFRILGRRDE